MHVVLKPFIKMLLWLCIILGVLNIAGVDVDSLASELKGMLEGLTGEQETQETEE